jgi:hypothetical protein
MEEEWETLYIWNAVPDTNTRSGSDVTYYLLPTWVQNSGEIPSGSGSKIYRKSERVPVKFDVPTKKNTRVFGSI